jgi:signal peptide peptidase SppA
MRYLHILAACSAEIWALQPSKLEAMSAFLLSKAAGGFGEDEIQARGPSTARQDRQARTSDAGTAIGVLSVHGILAQRMGIMTDISGGTSTEALAADFRSMLADPAIKTIVLDVDSPGGGVSGIAELADEIFHSRGTKPIVAQVNSLAASAAYWLASQADEIAVTTGGQAGSIGVYTIHDDISKAMEKAGVKETIIKAGWNKMIAPESQPLSEEAHGVLQARVNQSYGMFTRAVARGRGVSVSTVNDSFGQGLMFGAGELVHRGMADRVSTLPQTLARFGVDLHPIATRNSSAERHFAEMHASLDEARKALASMRQGANTSADRPLADYLADLRKALRLR